MEAINVDNSPKRLKNFAEFFKNYMSIWSLVVAALPIPVAKLDMIPTYTNQMKFLSLYASLICFLVLGYIFYSRHRIASLMFGNILNSKKNSRILFDWIPGVLIVLCIFSILFYHITINNSVNEFNNTISKYAGYEMTRSMTKQIDIDENFELLQLDSILAFKEEIKNKIQPDRKKYNSFTEYILQTTDLNSIPKQWSLIVFYLLIFIFAESAFILMALKEYLQDILGFSDNEIIQVSLTEKYASHSHKKLNYSPNVIYFIVLSGICLSPILALLFDSSFIVNPNYKAVAQIEHATNYKLIHFGIFLYLLILYFIHFIYKESFKNKKRVNFISRIFLIFGMLCLISLMTNRIILSEYYDLSFYSDLEQDLYNSNNWLDIIGLILLMLSLTFLVMGILPKFINQLYYSINDNEY